MSDNDTQESTSEEKPQFKKPVLFGRVGKLPKKAKNEPEKIPEKESFEKVEEEPVEKAEESNSKSSLAPAVLLKELCTPIPYKEPKWSGLCPDGSDYALEVLKSGMIVEKIELTTKPYYVFGRLANCDVVLAHPTISRYHCVLQYKAFASAGEPPSGWYMYELGSTHGTFLNKERVKPSHYVRVRVGHQIRFGNSTRTYIVLGPDFDCEGESELTVTEIKQRAEVMRVERDKMIEEVKQQREKERLEDERKKEEQGIDWGMSEDAEEEPDLAENPYASTTNEELYLQDPKKTLRGYFEREGHELQYDCEERGHGQFICRVELPLDDARGRPVMAEAIHTGKKKDAVITCALEACRILDRAGLLRQAKHESRRRKKRDWSADDYYDSDDDTFLDRTGHVERKRKARMERRDHAETENKALSYDDLLKQIKDIESKISLEERNLVRLRSTNKTNRHTDNDTDPLDEYMNTLSTAGQSMATKAEISTTKMAIQKLKAELLKTQRLAEIARPTHLPPLIKKDDKPTVKINNSTIYGKRIKLKTDITRPKPQIKKQDDSEFVEEMDSDEEDTLTDQHIGENVTGNTEETQTNTEITSTSGNKKETTSVNKTKSSENTVKSSKNTAKSSENTAKSSQNTAKSSENNTKSNENNTKSTENKTKPSKNIIKTDPTNKSTEIKATSSGDNKKKEIDISETVESERERMIYGPMRPPDNYVLPEDYFNQESDRDLPEIMDDE